MSYAHGPRAIGICQRSGKKMLRKNMVEDEQMPGLLVDPVWWEPKHPQEFNFEHDDPQALYRPAPDNEEGALPIDPEGTAIFMLVMDGFVGYDAVDVLVNLALSASSYASAQGANSVTIEAVRTLSNLADVSVHYATSDGTAVAGLDYTAASGDLNWAYGDGTNKSFNVSVVQTVNAKTFTVTLSAPAYATLVTPYVATVTIPALEGAGVLVRSSTGNNATGIMAFDTEDYDVGGWHSNVTNNSRITIMAGAEYVRFIGNLDTFGSSAIAGEMLRNGSTFIGAGKGSGDSGATNHVNICSAPMLGVANDYYEMTCTAWSTASWFAAEPIASSVPKAHYTKASTQSLSAGVETAITFSTQVYDNGGWRGVSTSKYIVPAGITRIVANAMIETTAAVSGGLLVLLKINGVWERGCPAGDQDVTGAERICISSPTLNVSPGDEIEVYATAGGSATVATASWFSIMEGENNTRCILYRAADFAIPGGSSVPMAMDSVLYDPDSLYDGTGVTVPAGYSQARAVYGFVAPTSADQTISSVGKNGSFTFGCPNVHNDTSGDDHHNGTGTWIDVVEGDEFRMYVFTQGGSTYSDRNGTYLFVELR